MELVAWLFEFALVNFVLLMLIAPPETKQSPDTGEKRVWFTRYTLLSYDLLVLSIVLYFILDSSGWK